MKQRQLEILLQQVPFPPSPTPNLEQYMTPAPIAADILFTAYQWGDIERKTVVDLGCGTGIFAVGAVYMGAKEVYGIDVDKTVISLAKQHARSTNLPIHFHAQDVTTVTTQCDTVLMNPPFGAQKSNQKADRKFIEKGFEIAPVIYSLHLKKTIPFIEKMIHALHGELTYQKDFEFPIKRMFQFHEKEVMKFKVTLLRILTPSVKSLHKREPKL
jgi:putative methylase